MARKRRGQRAKSEMNVVPYIDVMLVLLVIFMISAPLLNQSVEVSLPNAVKAEELELDTSEGAPEPIVLTIDENGAYYIDRADDNRLPVSLSVIKKVVREELELDSKTPVLIRADKSIDYQEVVMLVDTLNTINVPSVKLLMGE